MRNTTIGILAHVDAGKTTLSEQILCRAGAIRTAGRVDHGDTVMDSDEMERARGITIFSDQCELEFAGRRFTLIDTPGHVDFSAETERALAALDAAVLLQDASEPVRPHTVLLAEKAKAAGAGLLLFLNKCDLAGAKPAERAAETAERLGLEPLMMPCEAERLAELDETFLERYLAGNASPKDEREAMYRVFEGGDVLPVFTGSALSGQGVSELMEGIAALIRPREPEQGTAKAVVYKIRRDAKGQRMVFIRVTRGVIRTRDLVRVSETEQKISGIRAFSGSRYTARDQAEAGDAVALMGLTLFGCGDIIEFQNGALSPVGHKGISLRPALAAGVSATDGTDANVLQRALKELEDEDPQLSVTRARDGEILVHVMGPVQIEILEALIKSRFGIQVRFTDPRVEYLETIASPVRGCGHYEPLRHYAEVILRLEPAERGSGVSFASECHVDVLPLPFQTNIRTHVLDKEHVGVLTGSPLTDVRVVLTDGRRHLKHTEPGDFREAVYRAIRHGLRNAQCVLLEPVYRFEIAVPREQLGRVLSDIRLMDGEAETSETRGEICTVCGHGPVSTFSGYAVTLRALTHGEGSGLFTPDGYMPCHNTEEVIAERGYSPDADLDNPCGSVFCAHGAGYNVIWDEAESCMHCLKK